MCASRIVSGDGQLQLVGLGGWHSDNGSGGQLSGEVMVSDVAILRR